MRAALPTRVLSLTLGPVLCFGTALAGSNGASARTTVTRADVTHRTADGRAGEAFAVRKATSLLTHAQALIAEGRSTEAVLELNQLVRMQLPANRDVDKLLVESYTTLGGVYRAEGGGRKAAQFYGLAVQRMSPVSDSALIASTNRLIAELQSAAPVKPVAPNAAPAAPADAGDDTCGDAVAVSTPHSEVMTVNPAGDHNWRSYTTSEPSIVRIATNSVDIFGDDTDLTLYGGCSGTTPTDFVQFDDDGGPGFLSLIVTACLPAGTYFVEVGGFNDTEIPDNFDLTIDQLDTCVLPSPDQYEPDDELAQAKKIGFRNNGVGEGNQHGRNNNNIQHHSIFPAGDIDFVKFGLSRANLVRMETSGESNPDTIMGLSLPDGTLIAVNDDKAVGDFGSKLEVCLPAGDWRGIVLAFFANDTFLYDWAVDVEHPCNFESEPNGSFAGADPVALGGTISGLHTFAPVGDNDFFRFTLTETTQVLIETSGYDIFDVDTTLDLFDSNGNLIASDEDGGDGFLSRISVLLPPGTYYVNVWSLFAGYYFPYNLTITGTEPPQLESEPNADCGSGNAVTVGDSVQASISPAGDVDTFLLTVPADGFVEIETTGGIGDTVITIDSADGLSAIGCDDDAGDGFFSLWGCCLPAGQYCVQVKEYSPGATISSYTIEFRGAGTCTPGDPLSCPSTGLSCP